jgi:predicted exporter
MPTKTIRANSRVVMRGSLAGLGGLAIKPLSAFSTTVTFAVLATSAIPAVSALGATVTLIILLALFFVETDLFALRRHA